MVYDLVDKDENSEATVHMWFGDAEGLEWSNPIETPAKGIVSDKLKELKKGGRLLAAHFKNIDYDRSPKADIGYTGRVQFYDGGIYVVTYLMDDAPKAQIRGYSILFLFLRSVLFYIPFFLTKNYGLYIV